MNQDSLINILSMGDHGVYVWIVIVILSSQNEILKREKYKSWVKNI